MPAVITWLPKKANEIYTCHATFIDAFMLWSMYPRNFCESDLLAPTQNHTFTYLLHLPCSQLFCWIKNDIELHIKIKSCCWQNKIYVAFLLNIKLSLLGGRNIMNYFCEYKYININLNRYIYSCITILVLHMVRRLNFLTLSY